MLLEHAPKGMYTKPPIKIALLENKERLVWICGQSLYAAEAVLLVDVTVTLFFCSVFENHYHRKEESKIGAYFESAIAHCRSLD